MIKHLAPRSEEEIHAIKDKEYLKNRRSWSKEIQQAVNIFMHIDFLNYHKIKSIKYNCSKETLKIRYLNKTNETLLYNESISKWLNKAIIHYDERNVSHKTDINKILYNV